MKSQDTKNMMIVGGATVVGGIINYLVHPIAVRMLSVQEFGEFAALLGMVNIIGFIMSAGTIITLKLIAEHDSRSDFMYYLKHKVQWPLLGLGTILWIILGFASGWIARRLQISSIWGVIIMGGALLTSIYGIVLGAILQSGEWFKSLSVLGIIGSIVRLGLVVGGLMFIGGSNIALGGILAAGLIIFIMTEYLVRHHLGSHYDQDISQYDGTLIQQLQHHAKSYINLIIITVIIGILTNSDILIAQSVFGGELSGTYAAVATIAKFVVFIGLAAETVLLPKLFKSGQIPSLTQVGSIIGLLRCFGALALGGAWILGDWILTILKPGLGSQVPLLLGSIVISRCMLTLSISSKTLTNQGYHTPLWIVSTGLIVWYGISTMASGLVDYIYISSIILIVMSLIIQGKWLYTAYRQT